MATSEADIAAHLIERLLGDPGFRAAFRRDPAAACREAGLDGLADEMALGAGKAMMTLDVRESKSSLAGVMMAAAMEGVGVYQFGEHVLPHLADVPGAVSDVLSRVNLPALPGGGELAGAPEAPAAPAGGNGAEAAQEAAAPAAGGGGAAAAAAPIVAEPTGAEGAGAGKAAEAAKEAADAKAAGAAADAKPSPAEAAADKIAAAGSPEAKQAAAADEAVKKITEEAKDLPEGNAFPDGPVAPKDVEGGSPDTPAAAADAPAPVAPAPVAPAPVAPAAPVEPAAPAAPAVETVGGGDAAANALLKNANLVLDADAQKDIRGGAVDPRLIGLLGKLTEKHKIELSVIKTGHDQFTSGGSVSNHFEGRGLDIARVDGEIVNSGSTAARELASEIAALTGDLRPTEVGTPFPIGAPGFFTDGAHQDHLHVAFDGEPPAGFEAPAAAAPAAAPVAAAAATPAQPVAAPAAAEPSGRGGGDKASDTQAFAAVKAKAADAPGTNASQAFLEAIKPEAPPAAAAAVDPAAAGAGVDLSGVSDAYPGDDASREQIAAWMAKQAEARGLPPELPLMASLVESGMKNLNFGDADSVGFFQMRVSIWNSGEYAGYAEDPNKQVDWFLDHAEAVKEQRIARGQPIDDPNSYGEWIADVERPAEQFRGRYQLQLSTAQDLLQSRPQAPAAVPDPAAVQTPAAAAAPVEAAKGGSADSLGQGLLGNKNLILDADAQKDIGDGAVDPRILAVLDNLTQKHKIELSVIKTGHDQFTSGGSVSNHFVGRGIDIARVDGQIVNSGSTAARELATEIAALTGDVRPTEVGTPFSIGAPGFFTDGAHQDHIHVAFDGEPPAGFTPPAPSGAGAVAPVAAPAAVPGQPVAAAAAAAEPAGKPSDTLAFAAVEAKAADAPGKSESQAFLDAIKPAGPASAVAPPGTAPPAVADAAAATAAGSSPLGASALQVAKGELGVRETGDNTGVDVDKYLAAADMGPGNPWCASFVTWALAESGHKMDGGGWAAVSTWVQNAEQGKNDLQVVSADEARPGDIVAYDWGGQEDFGADGHIGFLESNVEGGKFTALEGNSGDAVLRVPRELGSGGANMKFIRINGGGAPPPAPPAAVPVEPAAAANGGAAPGGVAQAVADAGAGGGAGPRAMKAVEVAKQYLGTPYQWGGSTPETNFDCSGLMQWAYGQAGIKIPRVTYDQVGEGLEVGRNDLKPGDLVFFADGGDVHHVGMSLGGDKFIHAPHTGDVVKISSLNESYYAQQFDGGRRLDTAAGAAEPAAAAPVAAAAAAPAAAGSRPRGRRACAGRGRARRRRGAAQRQPAVHGGEGPGGAQGARHRDVHEGGRPEAGQGRRRGRRDAGRRRARRARRRPGRSPRPLRRRRLPGRQRLPGGAGEVARQRGQEGGPAAGAARHGLAGRVRRQEPQLRRRRFGRLLPDARRHLEPGRVRRLPREPRPAGQVVHRQRARRQAARDRRGRRGLRQGPREVGRVDRRHRAPRRAVPRPLPAAPRRGAGAARLLSPAASRSRTRRRRHRRHRHRRRRQAARSPSARRSGSPSARPCAEAAGTGVAPPPASGVGVAEPLSEPVFVFFLCGLLLSAGSPPPPATGRRWPPSRARRTSCPAPPSSWRPCRPSSHRPTRSPCRPRRRRRTPRAPRRP